MQTACLDFKGSDSRRCCACRVYKDQDDEGGASSPERSQLVDRQFKYKRVMLKISGEALEGAHEFGIDPTVLQRIAREVAEVSRSGVEVAIVVGGMFSTQTVPERVPQRKRCMPSIATPETEQ